MSPTVGTVYLRALGLADAATSFRWRNDPIVWRYTGARPDREITPEVELEWLRGALEDKSARRFAICLDQDDTERYVGNIQLTDITPASAQYHVFIGDRSYWGKGIASRATTALLDIAFGEMGLERVWLVVDARNIRAIQLYERHGFLRSDAPAAVEVPDGAIYMLRDRPTRATGGPTANPDA